MADTLGEVVISAYWLGQVFRCFSCGETPASVSQVCRDPRLTGRFVKAKIRAPRVSLLGAFRVGDQRILRVCDNNEAVCVCDGIHSCWAFLLSWFF